MKKYSIRANIDQDINKWLSVGTNLAVSRTEYNGLNSNASGLSGNNNNVNLDDTVFLNSSLRTRLSSQIADYTFFLDSADDRHGVAMVNTVDDNKSSYTNCDYSHNTCLAH